MKIKAESFLISKKKFTSDNVFITGSDESFISYTKKFVIKSFEKENFFLDTSGNYDNGVVGNLFSEKKTLFILEDIPKKNISELKDIINIKILVTSANGKKTNLIKNSLIKLGGWLIVECYALNRKTKQVVLKNYIQINNLILSADVFWYVIENFDNNYVIFINQLQMLNLFNKKIDLVSDIEKITFVDNKIEINKIFFNIFKENKILTNAFNKNVNSLSDFYIFLNSTKSYLEIIKSSKNSESALYNFPKYLFAEKDVFLTIYNKINNDKLIKIYKNLSKAELLVRQNSKLYLIIGLRFFLNLKKIITS